LSELGSNSEEDEKGPSSMEKAKLEILSRSRLTAEFDWLKVSALFLLIFAHSDLYYVFPQIILPIQWFLLSAFFFVSGFLAFNSLHKRGASIRDFLRSKLFSLYIPFATACVLYFVLEATFGAVNANPSSLLSQVSMLNMFDHWNSLYNWTFLWFIPCLLAFMLFICFLEKYVKNAKSQVLVVSLVWFCTILTWVYNAPMKLILDFSQYFLVFGSTNLRFTKGSWNLEPLLLHFLASRYFHWTSPVCSLLIIQRTP
jgi:hypothetical protein